VIVDGADSLFVAAAVGTGRVPLGGGGGTGPDDGADEGAGVVFGALDGCLTTGAAARGAAAISFSGSAGREKRLTRAVVMIATTSSATAPPAM
jgi:hypothetical protein